jgi:hypothetical protein
MVKYKNNYYFLGGTVWVYLLIKHAGIRYLLPDFVAYHLTDLLFIPLQLYSCLWITRILKRDRELLIPLRLILFVTVSMSILFEWYLPHYGRGTADLVDVLMYFTGGTIFYFAQRVL